MPTVALQMKMEIANMKMPTSTTIKNPLFLQAARKRDIPCTFAPAAINIPIPQPPLGDICTLKDRLYFPRKQQEPLHPRADNRTGDSSDKQIKACEKHPGRSRPGCFYVFAYNSSFNIDLSYAENYNNKVIVFWNMYAYAGGARNMKRMLKIFCVLFCAIPICSFEDTFLARQSHRADSQCLCRKILQALSV